MFLLGHTGFVAAPATALIKHRPNRTDDLRWLMAGTLLPDLVDKIIGQLLLKPRYENGRIYGHTVMFSSLLMVQGFKRLKKTGDRKALLLAAGVISHIALDNIWTTDPETAFWPLLGHFLKDPSLMSLREQVTHVLKDPFFWESEIAGGILLVLSLHSLGIRNGRDLARFILRGERPALSQPLPSH